MIFKFFLFTHFKFFGINPVEKTMQHLRGRSGADGPVIDPHWSLCMTKLQLRTGELMGMGPKAGEGSPSNVYTSLYPACLTQEKYYAVA